MSARAERLENVSRRSGAFVLTAIVMLAVVLLLTARAQRWFERTVPFEVRLPRSGTFGLRDGSAVEVLGTTAGSVDDVRIDERGELWAKIVVRADFARFVGADSTCTIKKRALDVAGDAYLEISRGTAPLPTDAVLSADASRGLSDTITDVVEELGRELKPAIPEIRAAVADYAELAHRLRDPDGDLQQTLQRLQALARRAEQDHGVVGRLLSDEGWASEVDGTLRSVRALADRLQEATAESAAAARGIDHLAAELADDRHGVVAAVADTRAVLAELRPILADLARAVAALPDVTEAARNEAKALPGLVRRSQDMVGEVERLVLAAQRHWLLAPYVEPTAPTQRVGGEGLGEGR